MRTPAVFSASRILLELSRVHGATSCTETTNERLGFSTAKAGRKSAATASVMELNFPLTRRGNKAKMGGSTSAADCRKIVGMPLITFEGSEGCGKSTQVKRLAALLEKKGIAIIVLREPGGTSIGEVIRHLLQHSEDSHG